ncbi:MAG: hypothetical protein E7037_02445 [Verrucomicrobia bacterium]|nr:hypothetical protein [Verrucomicrobiota bacterium]
MKERGKRANFFLDAQARTLLDDYAVKRHLPLSNVVCALLRALNGEEALAGEEIVFADLKKTFEREKCLRFFRSIKAVLPDRFKTVNDSTHESEYKPDFWISGDVGVYAFFASFAQTDKVIGTAFRLKAERNLRVLIVPVNGADEIDENIITDLKRAGVFIVSLGRLPCAIRENSV